VIFCLLSAGMLILAAVAESSQGNPSTGTPASQVFLQSLTEKEHVWLRDHPVIRIAQDPGWPPVEFTDMRGEPSGMAGDYLNLIEQRLGMKFERVLNLTWQEAYARMKRWEIDMTTSVAVTPERTEFWAFTKPYMVIPIVIIAHDDVTYIGNMRELSGEKVAIVDGYAVDDWIPRDYPDIRLVRVKTAEEGLLTLQRGEVFAYIENMLIVGYYMTKLKMSTLKIAGETPYVNAQCMAVRKDWAPLAGILQKALDSISEEERNEIYRKWLPIRYEHGFNYTLFWQVLGAFAVILLILLFWIRRLAREIRDRKKAEFASRESAKQFRQLFDVAVVPLCLIDTEGVLKDFNERFVQAFGYAHQGVPTLAEWWQFTYPDPDYRSRMVETWDAAVRHARENNTDIEPIECRMTCKEGEVRTIVITGTFLGDNLLAAFFDITDRKQAEEFLKESEHKYRIIAENMTDVITVMDMNLHFTYVSPSIIRMRGYTVEESMEQSLEQVMTPESLQIATQIFEEEMELEASGTADPGRVRIVELEEYRKDMSTVWVEVSLSFLRDTDGGAIGVLSLTRDITERKQAEEALGKTLESLRKAFKTTVQVMVSAVETRDPYTAGHQLRVAELACAIATEMGLSQEKIEGIRMASSIHDIGKLSIPAEILSKTTKLSELEFSLIKIHPQKGYEMLKDVESPWPLAEIVYQHHERMNGTGYPENLKGDEILMEARIIAVADVVEAMASHRPYRPTVGLDAALQEIENNRETFYDADVVDACLSLFRKKGYRLIGT